MNLRSRILFDQELNWKLSKSWYTKNTYIMRPRYAMLFRISFYVTFKVPVWVEN